MWFVPRNRKQGLQTPSKTQPTPACPQKPSRADHNYKPNINGYADPSTGQGTMPPLPTQPSPTKEARTTDKVSWSQTLTNPSTAQRLPPHFTQSPNMQQTPQLPSTTFQQPSISKFPTQNNEDNNVVNPGCTSVPETEPSIQQLIAKQSELQFSVFTANITTGIKSLMQLCEKTNERVAALESRIAPLEQALRQQQSRFNQALRQHQNKVEQAVQQLRTQLDRIHQRLSVLEQKSDLAHKKQKTYEDNAHLDALLPSDDQTAE
ncbi:hypothetical protein HPB48_022177 [Haemaphysalis longicornis]|uniref:Uncharacterized protein n=1 Tax=Haemaphysalis longicornis TaxID=44386 RepID=A0A9J6F9X6_HAELO|nr:hypothetical protein HPB48_022177 [Haemaphysalis longicornis]